VLSEWAFDSAPVTLLVPIRRGRTTRLQALMAFLEQSLGISAPQRQGRRRTP
jgi:hypothetical protein